MTSFERCRNNLKQTVAQDQKSMLLFIQYEVAQEKSVVDAFESFCEILGDDAMKYTDFDYWYYRFKDGKFDLDHDRSLNPPALGLSDMPVEVAENILKYLEWKDRCVVRKVSHTFQDLADISKQHFKKINLNVPLPCVELELNDHNSNSLYAVYYHDAYDRRVFVSRRDTAFQKIITNNNMWEVALNDLIFIFKNSKVRIDELIFEFYLYKRKDKRKRLMEAMKMFQSLNHQISVKKLRIVTNYEDEVLAILPHLKPGVLEHVEIRSYNSPSRMNFDVISESDQWKLAKTRIAPDIFCSQVDQLFNLTEFNAEVPSPNDVVKLINALRASPVFSWGNVLCAGIDTETIRIELGMEEETIEDNLKISFTSDYIEFTRIN